MLSPEQQDSNWILTKKLWSWFFLHSLQIIPHLSHCAMQQTQQASSPQACMRLGYPIRLHQTNHYFLETSGFPPSPYLSSESHHKRSWPGKSINTGKIPYTLPILKRREKQMAYRQPVKGSYFQDKSTFCNYITQLWNLVIGAKFRILITSDNLFPGLQITKMDFDALLYGFSLCISKTTENTGGAGTKRELEFSVCAVFQG